MKLVVNGKPAQFDDGTSLAEVIASYGLHVGSVVVEHNGTALLPSEQPRVPLADGDRLELVRAVAGG